MELYQILGLGELDCTVAILKNVVSGKLGKKDIIAVLWAAGGFFMQRCWRNFQRAARYFPAWVSQYRQR